MYTVRGCITISILSCQITHWASNALWQSWLPATKLSEDIFTGEGKSDSSKSSISVFFHPLSLFWPQLPLVIQCHCVSPFALYVPLEGFRCPDLHGTAIDEQPSVLWQLTFTMRLSLALPWCWASEQTNRKADAGYALELTNWSLESKSVSVSLKPQII